MADERYDISITKEYLIRNKAKLLYVSSATYSGDWLSTPHTHYCSELFYVLEGIGQFQVEDNIFPVKANDLIIINPNISHTELGLRYHPMKYIVLGIEGLELSSENDHSNFCIVNFKEIKDTMVFYLQMMLKEIETRAPGHEAICQDLMEILIVLFGRQTNFSTILTPANKKASHLCDSVRRYLDQNCEEDITLEQLARFSHVNKYYLVHAFTDEYGISPINYLMQARVKKAEKLLATTDYSMSVISSSCGFASSGYFSQTFKKITGLSPSAYRKKSKSEHEANS